MDGQTFFVDPHLKKSLTLPIVANAAVVGIKLLWRGAPIRTLNIISRLLGLKLDRVQLLTPSIAISRPRHAYGYGGDK